MLTSPAWRFRILRVCILSCIGGLAIYYANAKASNSAVQHSDCTAETCGITAEVSDVAVAKKQELEKRLRQHTPYACDYQESEHGFGGPMIGTKGNYQRLTHDAEGSFTFQDWTRFQIDLTTQRHAYNLVEELHVVANGRHAWHWQKRSKQGQPRNSQVAVQKDRIVMPRPPMSRKELLAALSGGPRVDPPYEIGHSFRRLFVLSPLYGIAEQRIQFVGEEVLDGEPVWHFSVQKAKTKPRAEHWIGAEDGVPRRIDIYDYRGQKVTTKIRLTNVRHRLQEDSQLFVFNDPGYRLVDAEKQRAVQREQLKRYKEKFGETIEEQIYRQVVATPAFEKARDVRGLGITAMSRDHYVRFQTELETRFVDQKKLKPYPPKEAATWFRKTLPEDAKHLSNLEELTCLFDSSDPDGGTWMLHNMRSNVYFFRTWHHW